jgi:hypothetical protein
VRLTSLSIADAAALMPAGAASTKAEAGIPPGLPVSGLRCVGHAQQQTARLFRPPLRLHSQPARLAGSEQVSRQSLTIENQEAPSRTQTRARICAS